MKHTHNTFLSLFAVNMFLSGGHLAKQHIINPNTPAKTGYIFDEEANKKIEPISSTICPALYFAPLRCHMWDDSVKGKNILESYIKRRIELIEKMKKLEGELKICKEDLYWLEKKINYLNSEKANSQKSTKTE